MADNHHVNANQSWYDALNDTPSAEVFIHEGVNGRWRDTLTREESAAYEKRAELELCAPVARWLATGEGSA